MGVLRTRGAAQPLVEDDAERRDIVRGAVGCRAGSDGDSLTRAQADRTRRAIALAWPAGSRLLDPARQQALAFFGAVLAVGLRLRKGRPPRCRPHARHAVKRS